MVGAAIAADITGTASGFGELRALWYAGADGAPVQLVERFRPTFQAAIGPKFELVTTLELGLAEGRTLQTELQRTFDASPIGTPFTTDGRSLFDLAGCSWPEGPDNDLFGIDGLADYARVDRLYADAYLKQVDLRVGRQAVQWGNAQLLHPADPFPEVLFIEPWRPRAGVNAARANIQLGTADTITLLAGVDDSLRYARLAGKMTANVAGTDLSVIGAWRQDAGSGIVGADVKGTALVGYWLEGSWHIQSERDDGWPPARPLTAFADGYEEFALGIDYSFPVLQQFVIVGQYYRNGAGSPNPSPEALSSRFSSSLAVPTCTSATFSLGATADTDPFAPVFVGRDYGMLLTQLVVDDHWSGNAAWVQNLGDGTGLAVPTVSYKPAGWSEISLSAQVPYRAWGDGGEFRPSDEDLVLSVPAVTGAEPIGVDLSGLVPDATVILWTRASF